MDKQALLIRFLEQEFDISEDAIALGLRKADSVTNLLPIALWEYGFVNTDQLSQIFDRLEVL